MVNPMYRKMKDSGIKWIGIIPQNWKVGKVKQALFRQNDKAMQENPVILSLARSGIKIRDISNNEGQLADSYYNYNPVKKGDLLLNPMDLYSGANCNVSKVDGVISPAYVNLRAKNGYIPQYYDYYFKTQYWGMALFAHGKGISFDNRWTLNNETLMNYYIPIPYQQEQQKIADYLDKKVTVIDNIIIKSILSIEEYKKYEQSLITEAVTKGLNSHVEMKNSGIAWIGELPNGYCIVKFNKIAKVASNLVHPQKYLTYIQVSPENIEKNSGKLMKCKTVLEVGVISDNHLFFKGQIIYSKVRPKLNKVIIAPFDGLCSADMYPIETALNSKFLMYYMLSYAFLTQVTINDNRVKMPKINKEELSAVLIVNPPETEQKEIAEYLDEKCAQINNIITHKKQLITELKIYKKSLIYECVTGKREVV